jgi:hypothetical protein
MAKDFKMTVGSHFVRLTEFTQRGKQAVVSFSQRFIEYGLAQRGVVSLRAKRLGCFVAVRKIIRSIVSIATT